MFPTEIDTFAGTVCALCSKDFNPIIEDLQSVSVCGHVFHEFCLQQHLSSSTTEKKHRCPMCRQKFSQKNVSRLYFKMIGEMEKSLPFDSTEDSMLGSQGYLEKLGKHLISLDQVFEQKDRQLKKLREELSVSKDAANNQEALKLEAHKEIETLRQMLQRRTEELSHSNTESSKLREKRSALRKELAAYKLGSTVDLDEEEISMLASDGHIMSSEDVVVTLRKALVHRNGSYKELMSECDLLREDGKRYEKKLAKAEKRIKKLKGKLKEMETALHDKDDQISKIAKSRRSKRAREGGVDISDDTPKLENINNGISKGKTQHADASPHTCSTEKFVDGSCDHVKENQEPEINNVKSCESERIYVDTEEGTAPHTETHIQSHLQGNSVQLAYSKESEKLFANEQIASHVGIAEQERNSFLTEPAYICHRDDKKHNADSHVNVHGGLINLNNEPVQIAKDNGEAHMSTANEERVGGVLRGSELASRSVDKGCRRGETEPEHLPSLENFGVEGKWGQHKSLVVREASSSRKYSKGSPKLSESNATRLGPRRNGTFKRTSAHMVAYEREEYPTNRYNEENTPRSWEASATPRWSKTLPMDEPSREPLFWDHSRTRDSRGLLGRKPAVVEHEYHCGSQVRVSSLPRQKQFSSLPRHHQGSTRRKARKCKVQHGSSHKPSKQKHAAHSASRHGAKQGGRRHESRDRKGYYIEWEVPLETSKVRHYAD